MDVEASDDDQCKYDEDDYRYGFVLVDHVDD